jgi:hypothetical protein
MIPIDVQRRIADFLVKHKRFAFTEGHLRLHILGTTKHHDGGTDYAVRTAIQDAYGKQQIFNSHIRIYPTGHLRLIR